MKSLWGRGCDAIPRIPASKVNASITKEASLGGGGSILFEGLLQLRPGFFVVSGVVVEPVAEKLLRGSIALTRRRARGRLSRRLANVGGVGPRPR